MGLILGHDPTAGMASSAGNGGLGGHHAGGSQLQVS